MIVCRWTIALGMCLPLAAGCHRGEPAAKSAPPAKVENPVPETNLSTVHLTPEAEARLGIRAVAVQESDLQRTRVVGGEIVVPPGQAIVVSAPITGTIHPPEPAQMPLVGARVAKDQVIFRLLPWLSPERDVLTPADRVRLAETRATLATAQIDAQRQVEAAQVEVSATETRLSRAEQMLKDGAASQQTVDDAQAQLALARKSFEAARARQAFLERATLDTEAGELSARTIATPVAGILSDLHVAPGQTVVAGASLFAVAEQERVWVRVPVYVGQRGEVAAAQDAIVREFGQPAKEPGRPAKPVAGTPSANASAATLDLYYELDNKDGRLRPGQRVSVTLPLASRARSLVVPWSAVVYDIHGGTWVYERTAPQTLVRRRVEVEAVLDGQAVLASGPKTGVKIVADGVAELYGVEFGFGK